MFDDVDKSNNSKSAKLKFAPYPFPSSPVPPFVIKKCISATGLPPVALRVRVGYTVKTVFSIFGPLLLPPRVQRTHRLQNLPR